MSRFGRKSFIALILIGCVLLLLILHVTLNVNPVIEQVSEEEVNALASIAINSACDEVLSEYLSLEMVDYLIDKDGNLQMVTTNTALINAITRKAVEASQSKISSMSERGIPIPLGSLSGMTVFSGQGPNVYIKAFPIGTVNSSISSEFIAAGINQTRHKIILNIYADVKVVLPGADNVVKTQTEILLCENLIIGKVPDVYFGTHNLSDLLNLVP